MGCWGSLGTGVCACPAAGPLSCPEAWEASIFPKGFTCGCSVGRRTRNGHAGRPSVPRSQKSQTNWLQENSPWELQELTGASALAATQQYGGVTGSRPLPRDRHSPGQAPMWPLSQRAWLSSLTPWLLARSPYSGSWGGGAAGPPPHMVQLQVGLLLAAWVAPGTHRTQRAGSGPCCQQQFLRPCQCPIVWRGLAPARSLREKAGGGWP